MAADLCPLTVMIDDDGRLYDRRFGGRYRVTEQTLKSDVAGGCKEKGATSSVRIQPAPHSRLGRVQEVIQIVRGTRPDIPVTTLTPHDRR